MSFYRTIEELKSNYKKDEPKAKQGFYRTIEELKSARAARLRRRRYKSFYRTIEELKY